MYANEKLSKMKKEDPETFGKKVKQEDLEVTGVSRSGRVRKKSSKLTDFESPDDLEPRMKKTFIKPYNVPTYDNISPESMTEHKDIKLNIKTELEIEEQFSDQESEEAYDSNIENESNISGDSEDNSDHDLEDSIDIENNSPSQSVYLQELSRKKTITTKEGKILVRNKAQRKDKGKSRFTAYMLWAKGVRNKIIKENPQLDFSAISKKLGELWSNVPHTEKYNWRRRAKRMALRVSKNDDNTTSNKLADKASNSQFLNKNKQIKPSSLSPKKLIDMEELSISSPQCVTTSDAVSPRSHASGMYKVTGSTPIDIAAYLKLLGESLSIIGERLKEHEGQIAVSGSLSVLLDSLLCSIGPLICLSQEVPEMNAEHGLDFSDLLDNIAYVMPGL